MNRCLFAKQEERTPLSGSPGRLCGKQLGREAVRGSGENGHFIQSSGNITDSDLRATAEVAAPIIEWGR